MHETSKQKLGSLTARHEHELGQLQELVRNLQDQLQLQHGSTTGGQQQVIPAGGHHGELELVNLNSSMNMFMLCSEGFLVHICRPATLSTMLLLQH